MDKRTDEQAVREKHPEAEVYEQGALQGQWAIYRTRHEDDFVPIGYGATKALAWANARRRLEAQPQPSALLKRSAEVAEKMKDVPKQQPADSAAGDLPEEADDEALEMFIERRMAQAKKWGHVEFQPVSRIFLEAVDVEVNKQIRLELRAANTRIAALEAALAQQADSAAGKPNEENNKRVRNDASEIHGTARVQPKLERNRGEVSSGEMPYEGSPLERRNLKRSIATLEADLAAMTEDRDLWRDEHEDDCPYKQRAETAEAALVQANERADAARVALREAIGKLQMVESFRWGTRFNVPSCSEAIEAGIRALARTPARPE